MFEDEQIEEISTPGVLASLESEKKL